MVMATSRPKTAPKPMKAQPVSWPNAVEVQVDFDG